MKSNEILNTTFSCVEVYLRKWRRRIRRRRGDGLEGGRGGGEGLRGGDVSVAGVVVRTDVLAPGSKLP